MVLKCLNHIYRLSTDVMFFTWSPFVWMKINWRQMRKDSVKWRQKTYWIVAPPSGRLWPTALQWKQCRGKRAGTQGGLFRCLILHGGGWNQIIFSKLYRIALKKGSVEHLKKRLVDLLVYFFLSGFKHFQYITIFITIIVIWNHQYHLVEDKSLVFRT